MADVKWIKLKVGMFDGQSFKKIKRAKIGGESFRDKLTAVWFELMDFAGKCNHGGAFIDSREIPFSDIEDIAVMIDRETDELKLCMQFYINEGMVEVVDDVFALSNWSVYQNEAGLEKIRERKRIAQAKWREKKRLQAASVEADVESTVDSTGGLPSISPSYSLNPVSKENNRGVGEEGEKQSKPPTPPRPAIPYERIKDMYNELCPSLHRCTKLSEARKKAIKARISSGYTLEDFERLFRKAEASSFLRGRNRQNWVASFDFLVRDEKMARTLDGEYDDNNGGGHGNGTAASGADAPKYGTWL